MLGKEKTPAESWYLVFHFFNSITFFKENIKVVLNDRMWFPRPWKLPVSLHNLQLRAVLAFQCVAPSWSLLSPSFPLWSSTHIPMDLNYPFFVSSEYSFQSCWRAYDLWTAFKQGLCLIYFWIHSTYLSLITY